MKIRKENEFQTKLKKRWLLEALHTIFDDSILQVELQITLSGF